MRDSYDPEESPPPPFRSQAQALAGRLRQAWREHPLAIAGGGAGLAVALLLVWVAWSLPIGRAMDPLPQPTLVLLTADGKPFARRGSYKEPPVDVRELPAHVPWAFVAIEDRRFFRHMGMDLRAIGRAAAANFRAGEVREGGSTITQQLAKNAFLTDERTYRRKAQEALIALYLEARLSKAEILSRYVSMVYFGDGVFGLGAAARHYFNTTPQSLTLGEAAMLAGMVKAPSRLAPTEDLAAARERQQVVLRRMLSMGLITEAQAGQARRVKLEAGRSALPVGSYFADWISPQAKRLFDRAYGEVQVRTTLDSALQARAERIVRATMEANGPRMNAGQAALIAMRPDGRIVAMVGGVDYRESQFNRAVQAERQPGSAFKLFVYAAAMRRGATPGSLVLDAPVTIGDWSPENHEEEYLNRPITLREAFARSSNVAAVRVAQRAGWSNVARAARDFGVTAPLPNDATLALGSAPMTLLELTAAYAAVAAGRAPVHPHGLAEDPPSTLAMRPAERARLLDLTRAVVTSGTGQAASAISPPAFGKTGTSQDYRDAWFVGFAGDLVVGVWVGNDDNTPMKKVTGGGLPAHMWRDFVNYAVSTGKVSAAQRPARSAEQEPPTLPADWIDLFSNDAPQVDYPEPPPVIDDAPEPVPRIEPPPAYAPIGPTGFPAYDTPPPPRLEPPPPRYEDDDDGPPLAPDGFPFGGAG